MPIFTATIAAVAVSAIQDLFSIQAPTNSRIRIREIRLGQYTDFGDAAAEILPIQIIRGHGTAGNLTNRVTPSNIHGWYGAPRDTGTTIARNDTGVATDTGTGNTNILIADAWNIAAGWWYYPPEEEMLILEKNQRLVVRLTGAPADAVTLNGTMVYEKIGQVPS